MSRDIKKSQWHFILNRITKILLTLKQDIRVRHSILYTAGWYNEVWLFVTQLFPPVNIQPRCVPLNLNLNQTTNLVLHHVIPPPPSPPSSSSPCPSCFHHRVRKIPNLCLPFYITRQHFFDLYCLSSHPCITPCLIDLPSAVSNNLSPISFIHPYTYIYPPIYPLCIP